MNPYITRDIAAQHDRDLRKQAAAARRGRLASRARRAAADGLS